MALQPFQDEQLNYFKFASIALNEFPKALRQTFRSMWDNNFGHFPAFQPWDDSIVVRNLFLAAEGGKTKVPTHLSYDEWDCTALFQATIYARSFALPDSTGHHRTLNDLYVKPHKLPLGRFHASVASPGGNKAETFALAIDQLRLLRNSLCHSSSSEIDKPTFDQYVQHAKDAFKAFGVKTDPIDVIGGLTESDFPTKEVRKLEQGIKEETRAYIKFLEGVNSDIDELRVLSTAIKGKVEGTASKEDIAMMLEQKINDLKEALLQEESDTKTSLPRTCLPPTVPHFTGRQGECDEITGHVTSESIRIVSIWGSPGFGKTSVATAVGHHLHSQGLPVYFLSLRGVQSKADLTSKLLSFFRRPTTNDRQPGRLSLDDELFQLLSEISDRFVLILDNADELFESGMPKVKEDFTHFLEEILRRTKKVTFVITTRESLEFMNVQFQGHHAVRIRPLDESYSQNLIKELLPNATPSDCIRITQVCGQVPLAIKLLCSSISEDDLQPSQVMDDFMRSLESNNIVDILDNPDYPSNLRLKHLFDSSFQRLATQEKEALVSLTVLPESFDITVAAAVLGISQMPVAKKVLHSLRRKSFLDSSSKSGSFVMHQLLLSFAGERGEQEIKETVLNAKSRLCAFYVSRFEKLNEQFLTGNSMTAFIEFYEDRQSYLQSLIEGCLDCKTSAAVFRALTKAELFLDSLFWCEGENIGKIYDSAIAAAKTDGQNVFFRQLLVSLALTEVPLGARGRTMPLLSEAKKSEASCSSVSFGDKGKHLCCSGIYQLVTGKTEEGVQCLEEALSLMNGTPEQRILRITAFQILATYYRLKKNTSRMSMFYGKALQECKTVGDPQLLIIPAIENRGEEIAGEMVQRDPDTLNNSPLTLEILCLVSKATKHLPETDTKQSVSNAVLKIVEEIEKPLLQSSLGFFNFQRNVTRIVQNVLGEPEEAANLSSANNTYHEKAIEQLQNIFETGYALHRELRANCLFDHAYFQYKLKNYSEALKAEQRSLEIRLEMFGQEHSKTAKSYFLLGATQHAQGDLSSAIQSIQRALDIRRKLFGEEHSSTADSYYLLGIIQHEQGDLALANQSKQRALDIVRKLLGEEHSSTADCYDSLGDTQHAQGDFTSADESKQHAIDIRRNLLGAEHSSTANSHHSLSNTQRARWFKRMRMFLRGNKHS
ncbi:hypothetical protein ACROYT_G006172 [Oculina patagonica]